MKRSAVSMSATLLVWVALGCVTETTRTDRFGLVPQEPPPKPSLPIAEGPSREVLVDWARRLRSRDRAARHAARQAALEGGAPSAAILAGLLELPDETVREIAVDLLARLGDAALPVVLEAAGSTDADTRYRVACVLRDMRPDDLRAVRALEVLLFDENPRAAAEAARALAFQQERAAPAVNALNAALQRRPRVIRAMAAGALASIGPAAAPAAQTLASALQDEDPWVRRAAAEALAAIGPAAASTVPALAAALADENLHVRACAIAALGSMGKAADAATPLLTRLESDAVLGNDARWALEQITQTKRPGPPSRTAAPPSTSESSNAAATPGWTMFCGSPARNAVSTATGLPATWNIESGENVRWSVPLGDVTYGAPIVSGGKVFVGTGGLTRKDRQKPPGLLLACGVDDGGLLWYDTARMLPHGLGNFLIGETSSSPLVEGDRLYYITAQGQLRCLDTEGFHDAENDGAIQNEEEESFGGADHIWELDLILDLGVFPHEAPSCSVVSSGHLLMVTTGNGVDEAHSNIPAPRAPSFVAVDKRTGQVVWSVNGPSAQVLHGQWSNPSLIELRGRDVALFGGGDGWLYALEAATGRELWRYDGNPKDAVWRTGGDVAGKVFRNNIIASPLVYEGRVFLAMGQDPEHGNGRGRLHAIDPGGQGDVTTSRKLWESADIGRTIATPIAHGGLLYAADYNGWVHCFDISTGEKVWQHDVLAGVWGCVLIADDKLYVGDEDGVLTVFALGRTRKILGQNELGAALWSPPAAWGGVLYVASARRLYALTVDEPTTR